MSREGHSLRLVVLGASRGTGGAVVSEAMRRGYQVTAVSRTIPPTAQDGAIWIAGDARDPAILERAFAVADAVVTAVVTAVGVKSPFSTTTLFSETAAAVVAAMRRAGVQRLIAVTGFGAGDSRGHGGFLFNRLVMPVVARRVYADKDREEAIIRGSDLRWTIVRPGALTNGPATGRVAPLLGPDEYRFGRISRADVARFVVDRVEANDFVSQTPVVVGG